MARIVRPSTRPRTRPPHVGAKQLAPRRACSPQSQKQAATPGDTACAAMASPARRPLTARAGNRRFGLPSARRSHTKAPYRIDLLGETLRPPNCPGRARTVPAAVKVRAPAHEDVGGAEPERA
jgi:hypothetical protein